MTETITPADHNAIRDRAAIVGIGQTEFSWDSGTIEISGRACVRIQPNNILLLSVRPMADEAVVRQQREDLASEVHGSALVLRR